MKKIILLCLILIGAALLWIPQGPALPPGLTFAQITNPSSSSGGTWDQLANPGGSLSLTMGANTSTFNTTTANATFFNWKNTTAAVVGTSQGSPVLTTCGRAFHGSADVEDCMTFGELPGNGNDAAIAFTIGHTGTSTGTVSLTTPILLIPNGSSATAGGLCFSSSLTSCLFNNGGNINVNGAAALVFDVAGTGQFVMNSTVLRDNNSNSSWTASTGLISAKLFGTPSNCAGVGTAASPSVATCGSAAAGHFSCATNATGATCQVNTTAVTANSEIFVFESDTTVTGTALSVTCNTSTNVLPASRLLASSVAGASFTINLGTVTTNPACFSYHIVN